MSSVVSVKMASPLSKTEECSRFIIGDAREQYTLLGAAAVGKEYTLSLWIKSAASGALITCGQTITTTTSWKKHVITFTASSTNLILDFTIAGTYYIYHPQLELGNVATDWTMAVEDVDAAIGGAVDSANKAQSTADGAQTSANNAQTSANNAQDSADNAQDTADNAQDTANNAMERVEDAEALIEILSNSIAMLVRDGNGGSLLKQDSTGLWYFDISNIQQTIYDNASGLEDLEGVVLDESGQIDVLQSTAAALQKRTEYIRSYTDSNGQPCLELGEGDSAFKLYITNTQIEFKDGTSTPAYITNQKLMIEKAEVVNELQFGGFIWKARSNGNIGLTWIGG